MPEARKFRGAKPPDAAFETRWPCPVCLGIQMEKTRIQRMGSAIVLDHCARCGGMWFEKGEVGELARQRPDALQEKIAQRTERVRPPCHQCHAPLDRNLEKCPACGHKNVLNCPMCNEAMERRAHGGLVLDVCRACQGVWFDNDELASIWKMSVAATQGAGVQRSSRGSEVAAIGGDVLLTAMFWSPNLVFYGAAAAGNVISGAASSLGSLSAGGAADAATGAVEAVGSAAEGVFATIMEIISSIFD